MPTVGYVQSGSNLTVTQIVRGSTTPINTTLTITVTAGNFLVIAVGGLADGGGVIDSPVVSDTDSLGNPTTNVYTQRQWDGSFVQHPGLGLYTCPITQGGTLIIKFQGTATAPIGLVFSFPAVAIAVLECSNITAYQDSNIFQNGVGGGGNTLPLTDFLGATQTVTYVTPSGENQFAAAAIDVEGFGIDFYVAAASGTTSDIATVPTISPAPLTFTLKENPTIGWGLGVFIAGGGTISNPTISCGSPPSGQVGVPYSHTFPASGGTPPYTFSIISGSLPTGLSLNSSTGAVTGTPIAAGTFPFTVQVTDSIGGTGTADCSITISANSPTVGCGSPPDGEVGVAYTHTFPASGGISPYTFSITSGSLPTGVTLNASTGVASGTPTTSGIFPFTIQVQDNIGQTATANCSITIAGIVTIACGSPPVATAGTSYTHTFPASGGTTPYTFAITSGSLPPGLSLDASTGIVSGIPTTVGDYPFTIQVTDAMSNTASVNCSITVISTLAMNCNNPPDGTVGTPYVHALSVTGGTLPYTFSITSGGLPPGLNLDPSTGVISGTPTAAGNFTFAVRVEDTSTASASCLITIKVTPTISTGCPPATGNLETPYDNFLPFSGGIGPYTFAIISGTLPTGLTLNTSTGEITGVPTAAGTFPFSWSLDDSAGAHIVTNCSIVIGCPVGSEFAKFQLWSVTFITEPADRAAVTHSYDYDRLGWPYDKKLKSITFEYDGSHGDVDMKMETLLGINGITEGTPLIFHLLGNTRALQQFGIPDGNVVKMVRLSPVAAPDLNFKSWHYDIEKEDYPPDFVLFTEKNIFGYECEKIARNLELDIDTGGVEASIDLFADGVLKQGDIKITTTSNDRSRIIALNSNLIGREWYLHLAPGQGGKTQLFRWNLENVKEPCAVTRVDTYEQRFGYIGFKWVKQIWVAYQSDDQLSLKIYVDNDLLFFSTTLPAHPFRDEERFYLPMEGLLPGDDGPIHVLNKSKTYRIVIEAVTGKFKLYSDSGIEWSAIGAGQRLQNFYLTAREQQPVS